MILTHDSQLTRLSKLLTAEVIAYDTETTGLNTRLDKVIGFSISDGTESYYISHLEWDNLGQVLKTNVSFEACKHILKVLAGKRLLTFNGLFDVNITLSYFGIDLVDYMHADVMLMAHTCDENLDNYSMKPMAEKFLGIKSTEQAELKAEMKSGGYKEFYKVPLNIMGKYAAQDAVLTFELYKYWSAKLTAVELFDTEIMPMYKTVVIPMVRRGVALDMTQLVIDQAEITQDIKRLEQKIQTQVGPYLLPFKDWFYNKHYPFKSRGKMAALRKWNPLASDRAIQMLAFKQDGGTYEFNINSDIHLRMLFFDSLKCTPVSYTDGGLPRADSDFLETVKDKFSFATEIINYNKLQKIKATYIDRFIEESEGGIFYPQYFMHRTVSGRLSGDMQQLPRPVEHGDPTVLKYNNNIRKYFISRPGHIFIDDDYNSLEPRVFAAVAGDVALKEIFSNGEDFYSKIAIMVEGLKDVSPDKSAPNYLGKVNKAARQTAKAYSLGIAYGLDDYKLHKDLGISQDEAKKLVAGYFSAFPQLAKWQENTRKSILSTGEISTRFGRIRHNPDVPTMYKKHGDAILNALELWKLYMGDSNAPKAAEYAAAKRDYKEVRHAINNAYNHQIQGLSAHIMNRAAIRIAKEFKALNLDAQIIGQIHDELIIECVESQKSVVSDIIRKCMQDTTKIEVDLIAEPSYGYNLRDAKGE